MEVVVLGASGFIGKYLIKNLISKKEISKVTLIGRNENKLSEFLNEDKCNFFQGNILDIDSLKGCFQENSIVINLVYLNGDSGENIEGIRNLLKICKESKIKRFIHLSTAVIVGKSSESPIDEKTHLIPANEYELTKFNLEQEVNKEWSFETVILRPTAVFGKGGMNLIKLNHDLKNKSKWINYVKSCLYNKRKFNLVSVWNVVSAITFLIKYERLINRETYIIADDESSFNNYRDVEKAMINSLNISDYAIPRIVVPGLILTIILKLAGQSNTNPNRIYSCDKLKSVGWKRDHSFKEDLDRYLFEAF